MKCLQHPIYKVPADKYLRDILIQGCFVFGTGKKRRGMDQTGTDRHSIYAARLGIKILTVPCVYRRLCVPCHFSRPYLFPGYGDMSTDQQETVQRSKHQLAVVQLASTSTKSR